MWDNDPHVLSFPGPGVWPPLPALPLYGGLGSCPGSREGAKEHLGAPVGGSQPQALRVGEEAVAEGLALSEAACLSSTCSAQPSWLPVASRL